MKHKIGEVCFVVWFLPLLFSQMAEMYITAGFVASMLLLIVTLYCLWE